MRRAQLRGEVVATLPALRAFARGLRSEHAEADALVEKALQYALGEIDAFEGAMTVEPWLRKLILVAHHGCDQSATQARPPANHLTTGPTAACFDDRQSTEMRIKARDKQARPTGSPSRCRFEEGG